MEVRVFGPGGFINSREWRFKSRGAAGWRVISERGPTHKRGGVRPLLLLDTRRTESGVSTASEPGAHSLSAPEEGRAAARVKPCKKKNESLVRKYLLVRNWVVAIERHNPYLATPGHIRDPILKRCTHPYPPVDVQWLAARDSWHSSKIIHVDEKNTRII
jgi:hypothetical protein